jgi:hypothetical protein
LSQLLSWWNLADDEQGMAKRNHTAQETVTMLRQVKVWPADDYSTP